MKTARRTCKVSSERDPFQQREQLPSGRFSHFQSGRLSVDILAFDLPSRRGGSVGLQRDHREPASERCKQELAQRSWRREGSSTKKKGAQQHTYLDVHQDTIDPSFPSLIKQFDTLLPVTSEDNLSDAFLDELPLQDCSINQIVPVKPMRVSRGKEKWRKSRNERERRERTHSQQRTFNPLNGAEPSSGCDKNTLGTSPLEALGAVIPSMTGIARESSCLRPRSTERAVMKHRKIEPSPTVEATSMRPA